MQNRKLLKMGNFDFAADPPPPPRRILKMGVVLLKTEPAKKNPPIPSKTVACDPVIKFLVLQNCLKIPPPFSYFGHNHLYFMISLVFKKSCPLLFQPKKEAREGALDFKLNIYHDQPK